jgi:hypothetical protein
MQSGHYPMGYFALGIGALHSTTSSRLDFMVSNGTLVRPSPIPPTTASGPNRTFTRPLSIEMREQQHAFLLVRIGPSYDRGGRGVGQVGR